MIDQDSSLPHLSPRLEMFVDMRCRRTNERMNETERIRVNILINFINYHQMRYENSWGEKETNSILSP